MMLQELASRLGQLLKQGIDPKTPVYLKNGMDLWMELKALETYQVKDRGLIWGGLEAYSKEGTERQIALLE